MPPTPYPFLLGGVREGFGNALILEGSSKDAFLALRRFFFYVVLEALGGAHHEHQEHLRYRQGMLQNRLGNF